MRIAISLAKAEKMQKAHKNEFCPFLRKLYRNVISGMSPPHGHYSELPN
jgi:hypothetical protein